MKEKNAPKVVVVMGCTGTKKTEVSIGLADAIGGEILSADKMQVSAKVAKIRHSVDQLNILLVCKFPH